MDNIKFNVTYQDLINFHLHSIGKRYDLIYGLRNGLLFFLMAVLYIGIYSLIINHFHFSFLYNRFLSILTDFYAFLAIISFLLLFAPKLKKHRYLKNLNKAYQKFPPAAIIGDIEISLNPEGFSIKGAISQVFYKWPALLQMYLAPNYLYFYISAFGAHIIPRRAFKDNHQLQAFMDTAEKLYKAYKNKG